MPGGDSRLGRWTALDPEAGQLPWSSPYVGMNNNPVSARQDL